MNPFLIGKLVGAGLLAAGLLWAVSKVAGWHSDSVELETIKPAYAALVKARDQANEAVEEQAPVDEAVRRELSEEKRRAEEAEAALRKARSRIKAVEEKLDEAGNITVRLSDAWGVCFSAVAAGDAADVAACEAAGSDGAIERQPSS